MDAETAAKIWRYDPETGHFFWLVSPGGNVAVGDRAGFFDGKYWRLHYRDYECKAGRMAWLMMTGEWPVGQIDHKNRNKLDDRFKNLREASSTENAYNRKRITKNRLGVKGVHPVGNRFVAVIGVNGKRTKLGSFESIKEAKAVYDAAVKRYHGEFASL